MIFCALTFSKTVETVFFTANKPLSVIIHFVCYIIKLFSFFDIFRIIYYKIRSFS